MNNIKISQLKDVIKQIIRESLQERTSQFEQVGADVVAEKAPPGFGPGKEHADIYDKVKQQYGADSPKAYATMWSIYKKMQEGMTNEAGLTSEKNEKWIQKDVNPRRKDLVKRFKKGLREAGYKIVPNTSSEVQKDDHARAIQTDPTVTEASYKVVSPTQARTSNCDHARTIQTEPEVTENHKVQARSAKTVNDLDNDPNNVRDPEIPQA